MNNIIRDSLSLKDNTSAPIKGVIKIYDKNGILVQEAHNMVVSSGRQLLFNMMREALGDTSIDSIASQTFSLDNLKFFINFSYLENQIATSSLLTLSDVRPTVNNVPIRQITKALDGDSLTAEFSDLTFKF